MLKPAMISNHHTSVNEMWKFIDNMMRLNDLVPDRSIFAYDQVFPVYSKLCEIDAILSDSAQINILKQELASLKQ